MAMLFAFSPFLALLVGRHLLGIVPALCAGGAVAVALVLRERLRGVREVRVLEVRTAVLGGALALAARFTPAVTRSVGLVRLVVDCGLMLLVLAGVAVWQPFTLVIARERVTAEVAASPAFLRRIQLIAAACAGAFGVLAVSIASGAACLIASFKITQRLSWPAD